MKDEYKIAMMREVIAQTNYEIDQLLISFSALDDNCLSAAFSKNASIPPRCSTDSEDFKTHLSRIESCAREIIDLVEKYK